MQAYCGICPNPPPSSAVVCSATCCCPGGTCSPIPVSQATLFTFTVLFGRLTAVEILTLGESLGTQFGCMIQNLINLYTMNGYFNSNLFYVSLWYSFVISSLNSPSATLTCTTLSNPFFFIVSNGLNIDQVILMTKSYTVRDSFYREGLCARDHVSCDAVIAESASVGTSSVPIVSVSNLESRAFSGMVAHMDATVEFINCRYTPILSDSNLNLKWQFQLPLDSLTALEAVVLDEKPFFVTGVEAVATMIGIRFTGTVLNNSGVQEQASGVIILVLASSPILGPVNFVTFGPYLTERPIRENQVTVQADRSRTDFYYLGFGSPDSNTYNNQYVTLVQLNGIDLTLGSLAKLAAIPAGSSLFELERVFRAKYLYGKKPISTFHVCDCRIAVGYDDGAVHFYCCQTFQSFNAEISPICSCCDVGIPTKIRWCCRSRTLVVLYTRYIVQDQRLRHFRTQTFLRAYFVDFERLADPHNDDNLRSCIETLWSVKGCGAVNFEICCRRDRECPIVYVLADNHGKWYLRAYEDGKLLATARLNGRVAGGSMSLSSCQDGRRCRCCKCGVFIPFTLPDGESGLRHLEPSTTTFVNPVVCLCIRQCGSGERDNDDRFIF